jgi:NADPH-dependent 2,4-dienoyl-CoA reductase/sulfur reductase-like enzyme
LKWFSLTENCHNLKISSASALFSGICWISNDIQQKLDIYQIKVLKDSMSHPEILIIGGGIIGLAAAYQVTKLRPQKSEVKAIHVPQTGIVDFTQSLRPPGRPHQG